MKKQVLFTILAMLVSVSAFSHDIAVKNADGVTIYYNYSSDGTKLEVTHRGGYYNCYSGNVVIPEEVTYMNRTRKVTSIGESAFYDCSGLTSVTIPNSVTSIGDETFRGCSGLKKVIVKDIAAWCGIKFSNQYSNPLYYAKHLYSDEDTEITNLIIPNSVTSIGESTFYKCSGLTSVTIPNSVTSIGNEAFDGCDGLKKVIVKDIAAWCGIKFSTTGSNPLLYAHHLYSDEDTEITNLIIPNSVTSIGDAAFYGCKSLISVTIPNSVTSIGSWAFYGCSRLTSVTIPNSMTSIEGGTFYGCSGLTSVTIPNSVTSIGRAAFELCTGLTSVKVEEGNPKYDSRNNCNAIIETETNEFILGCKNSIIPNSVTGIGNRAFYGCSGLTSVTIPNSVTSMGEGAFEGADIPTVISLIEKPFAISGKKSDLRTFSQNTFINATLYVPKGTIEKYKATEGWKDFFFIEEGEGLGGDTPQPPTPEPQKCATPTISYENGKLKFSCETEGVEFVYNITPPSAKAGKGTDIGLPTTYKVTVYATKAGYDNSDVATKEINLGGGGAQDVNGDGIVDTQDVLEIYKYMQEH